MSCRKLRTRKDKKARSSISKSGEKNFEDDVQLEDLDLESSEEEWSESENRFDDPDETDEEFDRPLQSLGKRGTKTQNIRNQRHKLELPIKKEEILPTRQIQNRDRDSKLVKAKKSSKTEPHKPMCAHAMKVDPYESTIVYMKSLDLQTY